MSMMGYEKRNILTAFDDEATLGTIRRLIEVELPGKANTESDVFIFYSGHGIPDLEDRTSYIMPYDGAARAPRQTSYALSELFTQLYSLPVKSVTVVIDACFSGSFDGGTLFPNTSGIAIKRRAIMPNVAKGSAFLATRGNQVAYWYPEKRHSMLTYFFLLGLRGAADENGDEKVTIAEMEEYLQTVVPEEVKRKRRGEQTPEVMGSGDKHRQLVEGVRLKGRVR